MAVSSPAVSNHSRTVLERPDTDAARASPTGHKASAANAKPHVSPCQDFMVPPSSIGLNEIQGSSLAATTTEQPVPLNKRFACLKHGGMTALTWEAHRKPSMSINE
jgi:hypothetical protein